MFASPNLTAATKAELYQDLAQMLSGMLAGEHDLVANAANTSALLSQYLPDLNWVGFYFLHNEKELLLGPFQGKPACVRIAVGRGVCGTAVAEARSMCVPDVHAFADHIACDANSNSELVVPLLEDGRVLGVIDLDSPLLNRFDADDQAGVERIAALFVGSLRSVA